MARADAVRGGYTLSRTQCGPVTVTLSVGHLDRMPRCAACGRVLMTDDMLEAASGIKARTIKSYRLGDAVPSLEKALSLACVIGPTAINPLLALIGYVARPLDEADDIAPVMIVANGMRHMATIAAAAADGRIDHTEERDCQKAADAIIEAVLPLSSAGRAQ